MFFYLYFSDGANISTVRQELRNAFAPTRTSAPVATRHVGSLTSTRRGRSRRSVGQRRSLVRYFCCLAECSASQVPNGDVLASLQTRGLGSKEIEIPLAASFSDINTIVLEQFPCLNGCGGLELLKAAPGSRAFIHLPGDVSAEYLCNHTRSNSRIYIRPIQRDVVLDQMTVVRKEIHFLIGCLK